MSEVQQPRPDRGYDHGESRRHYPARDRDNEL